MSANHVIPTAGQRNREKKALGNNNSKRLGFLPPDKGWLPCDYLVDEELRAKGLRSVIAFRSLQELGSADFFTRKLTLIIFSF